MKDRNDLIDFIIKLWNDEEQNLLSQIAYKEVTRNKSSKFLLMNLKDIKEIALVPFSVKLKKILKQIKTFVAGYISDMVEYKSNMRMKKSISKNWIKSSFHIFQTRKPVSPNLRLEFTREVIQQMITKSQKYRRTSTFITF